jgi:hypothetical protein
MKTYVALLRGINLGAHNKVPMADLRALFAGLGAKLVSVQHSSYCSAARSQPKRSSSQNASPAMPRLHSSDSTQSVAPASARGVDRNSGLRAPMCFAMYSASRPRLGSTSDESE